MALKYLMSVCLILTGVTVTSSLPVGSDTFSTVQSYDGLDVGTHVYWKFQAPYSEGTRKLQLNNNTDVALQITIYFNSHSSAGNLVELNSCTGGSWNGPVWCTGFPFTAGERNQAVVVVGKNNYEVVVKETDFSCKYDHYTPPEDVKTVQTTHGGVEFTRVLMNYEPGRVILIHGKGNKHITIGIDIVLSDLDPNTLSPISTPLFMHVYDSYTKVKLRTSLEDSPTQVIPESPIKFQQEFVLAIICQTYGYEIMVNGTHFAPFEHHIPFKQEMRIAVWHTETHKIEYY